MLFSESMCFLKKTRKIPEPIMDFNGQVIQTSRRSPNLENMTLPPTRPARAYSNKQATSPVKTPSATSPSWMRKVSVGSYARSGSVDSTASTASKLSFSSLRRKKAEAEPVRERQPSIFINHTDGGSGTVFTHAGRDERGRLKLDYHEYEAGQR